MAEKGTLQYKLTKITGKTVLAAIVCGIMFYLAKDRGLQPVWFVPGAVLTLLGEWLRLWAAGHLRKNKQLTTTGPYSYVKNPLYIGTLLITLGYSAMAMNYWIMIGGFVWFFIYYAPYKKKQESEKLVGSFGQPWIEFIPSISACARFFSWTKRQQLHSAVDGGGIRPGRLPRRNVIRP